MSYEGAMQRIERHATRIEGVLVVFEKVALVLLLTALSLAVLLQVLSRYFFAEPNPWSEEIARYLFVWMSMIGASLALKLRGHFGLDILSHRLTARTMRGVEWVAVFTMLATTVTFSVQGIRFVQINSLGTAPATGIPMIWVNAAIPVGMALMVIHLIFRIIHDLTKADEHD